MPESYSVDLRPRVDGDVTAVDPHAFFSMQLPTALAATRELIEPGAGRLGLGALTVEVAGQAWSLGYDRAGIRVRSGFIDGAAHVRMSGTELTELVHDQRTPMTSFTSGTLDMPAGGVDDFLDWWLVLRAVLDRRPLHTPGAITFADAGGAPLDLGRCFRLDDPVDEMSHFLRQAGYLRIGGVFAESEMARISAEMDEAAPSYREGDGQSWWATTATGVRRLVRMQGFDEHSPATAALLRDERDGTSEIPRTIPRARPCLVPLPARRRLTI